MLAWSPDGKWLCFTDEIGTSGHHVLFVMSPESGAVKRLLQQEEDNGIGDSSPAFSPDGRWLAFGRFEHPYNSHLLLQRLSPDLTPEGAPVVVRDAGVNPRAPVWMPDGKKILFLDRSRIMEAEIGGPARIFTFRVRFQRTYDSGPRPRLVACLQNQHEEIWTIPLGAKGLKADGNAQHILQSSAGESHPRFSPDGRSLAFSSNRSGSSEVWLADSDGKNPRQLTHLSFYIAGYLRWSPDGQSLAFHARLPSDPQLYVLRVGDGLVKQITRGKPGFMGPS
jgi:Tol biopolymer transport system component